MPVNPDLVITITGGGNDLFYIGSMFGYTLKHTLWGKLVTRFLMSKEENECCEHPTIATPEEVSERFSVLLDKITEKDPKATVYLVEYFAMMGPDTVAGRDVGWDQQQIDKPVDSSCSKRSTQCAHRPAGRRVEAEACAGISGAVGLGWPPLEVLHPWRLPSQPHRHESRSRHPL